MKQYPVKKDDRYGLTRKIASCWFKTIESLPETRVTSLIKDIRGKTLVGNYVGGKDLSRAIKYQKEAILF